MFNKTNIKRISSDYSTISQIVELFKIIYGNVDNFKTYRTRKIWAIKRSPHVFSKSQEAFGYEVYTGQRNINFTQKFRKWPVEIKYVLNSIRHLIPGIFWSFNSKRKSK